MQTAAIASQQQSRLLRLPGEIRNRIWTYSLQRISRHDTWGGAPGCWSSHGHFLNGNIHWGCIHEANNGSNALVSPRTIEPRHSSTSLLRVCTLMYEEILRTLINGTNFELILGPPILEKDGLKRRLSTWYKLLLALQPLPPMESITLVIQPGFDADVQLYARHLCWILKLLKHNRCPIKHVCLRFNLSCFMPRADQQRTVALFQVLHDKTFGEAQVIAESLNNLSCSLADLQHFRSWQKGPEDVDRTRAKALQSSRRACMYLGAEHPWRHSSYRQQVASFTLKSTFCCIWLITLPVSLPLTGFVYYYSKAWD